jgi:hypothetical protein
MPDYFAKYNLALVFLLWNALFGRVKLTLLRGHKIGTQSIGGLCPLMTEVSGFHRFQVQLGGARADGRKAVEADGIRSSVCVEAVGEDLQSV